MSLEYLVILLVVLLTVLGWFGRGRWYGVTGTPPNYGFGDIIGLLITILIEVILIVIIFAVIGGGGGIIIGHR